MQDAVVTLRGPVRDRALVPHPARAIRAVEGVVDVRMELDGAVSTPEWTRPAATTVVDAPAPAGRGRPGASPAERVLTTPS
ncbi:hypothetical protein [Streptomyces sp. NBC_01233]|uniref:hypothetical protein n=1 Tax=Streptomyces sp. NBC_01233 TaxID=2903787 RepID=UPI003FA3451E